MFRTRNNRSQFIILIIIIISIIIVIINIFIIIIIIVAFVVVVIIIIIVWEEITYPFPNCNGCIFDVFDNVMDNFTLLLIIDLRIHLRIIDNPH